MDYQWKLWPEIGFAIVIAVGITFATMLVDWDPNEITDWDTWGVSVLGGLVRSAAVAFLAGLRRFVI